MDSTVIQEIANQLGMAVDKAGQFLIEQLPNYAALKVAQLGIPMAIMWALFIVLAAVSLTSIALCFRWSKKEKEKYEKAKKESSKYVSSFDFNTRIDDYIAYYVFAITGCIAIFIALISILVTIFCAIDIYGWLNYPEAMLMDMAIQAIG